MIGVYCITNKINNHQYVGMSGDIELRWKGHIYESRCCSSKSYDFVLYRAFRKYGINNFDFRILEECLDIETALVREAYWINILDTKNNGYNETDGGVGCGDRKGSHNGRAKLTEADVINIRIARKNKENRREVYEKYGDKITFQSFVNVWQGVNWKHIMPEIYTPEAIMIENRKQERAKGSKNHSSKLIELDIVNIRKRKNNGETRESIYQDYKNIIGQSAFSSIWNEQTWKHVRV